MLRGMAEMLAATESDVVLDAGCGEGFYLGSIAASPLVCPAMTPDPPGSAVSAT